MKITVLVDNAPDECDSTIETEHGLSIYIEHGERKILLDVGASSMFMRNAERMGIDIAGVDTLVLSHAHSDHTGGLETFLRNNTRARVFLSAHANGDGYFSTRRGRKRNISIDYAIVTAQRQRFTLVDGDMAIGDDMYIISDIPVSTGMPKADATLLAGDGRDSFNHEMALLIGSGSGIGIGRGIGDVLFSSCTHKGLLNTLSACSKAFADGDKRHVTTFFGGLHLVDSDATCQFETMEEIKEMGLTVLSEYPDMSIYTGHCTGMLAKSTLRTFMGDRFHVFHSGMRVTL